MWLAEGVAARFSKLRSNPGSSLAGRPRLTMKWSDTTERFQARNCRRTRLGLRSAMRWSRSPGTRTGVVRSDRLSPTRPCVLGSRPRRTQCQEAPGTGSIVGCTESACRGCDRGADLECVAGGSDACPTAGEGRRAAAVLNRQVRADYNSAARSAFVQGPRGNVVVPPHGRGRESGSPRDRSAGGLIILATRITRRFAGCC